MYRKDTIVAIATPPGLGALGVIRVSGDEAVEIVDLLFKSPRGRRIADLNTYTAAHGYIQDHEEKTIDEVVVLVMKGPHSFTGEDVVEISGHGGPLPLHSILSLLLAEGARLAEPGEFTKRAFLNGRLDLSQAEAVIDVITAKTEKGLNLAVQQLQGNLSFFVNKIRVGLIGLLASIEASVDFPEEELDGLSTEDGIHILQESLDEIERALATGSRGKIFREGLRTVIIGRPNVGKSTLLNALLGEERALVTEIPGTTRDFIEEVINLNGIPLRLTDTAGLRDTQDLIERMGVEKTKKRLQASDLVIVVVDVTEGITPQDMEIISDVPPRQSIIVINKTDVKKEIDLGPLLETFAREDIILISALKGAGLEKMTAAILRKIIGPSSATEDILIANIRHEKALQGASDSVQAALAGWGIVPVDLLAIDIRAALAHLGKITGETIETDITRQIFSRFCIGK